MSARVPLTLCLIKNKEKLPIDPHMTDKIGFLLQLAHNAATKIQELELAIFDGDELRMTPHALIPSITFITELAAMGWPGLRRLKIHQHFSLTLLFPSFLDWMSVNCPLLTSLDIYFIPRPDKTEELIPQNLVMQRRLVNMLHFGIHLSDSHLTLAQLDRLREERKGQNAQSSLEVQRLAVQGFAPNVRKAAMARFRRHQRIEREREVIGHRHVEVDKLITNLRYMATICPNLNSLSMDPSTVRELALIHPSRRRRIVFPNVKQLSIVKVTHTRVFCSHGSIHGSITFLPNFLLHIS